MLPAVEGIAGDRHVVCERPEALDFAEESSAISASCSNSSSSACNLRCTASARRRAASSSAAARRCAAVSAAAAASASASRIWFFSRVSSRARSNAEYLEDATDTVPTSDAITDTMDVVIDSASVAVGPSQACLVGSSRTSCVGSSRTSWALAFATEQGGLTDWLFVELVGTPPLSVRCCFSGGSGVLKEPEESVIWIKDSSGSMDEPISTGNGIMVLRVVLNESIRLITCRMGYILSLTDSLFPCKYGALRSFRYARSGFACV